MLWFCYNNDIEYLRNERCNPILRRYLTDAKFAHSLSSRQPEIEKALSGLVAKLGKKTNWRENTVFRILRLQNLRYRIAPPAPVQGQKGRDLIAEYGKVLIKSRATIAVGRQTGVCPFAVSTKIFYTRTRLQLKRHQFVKIRYSLWRRKPVLP